MGKDKFGTEFNWPFFQFHEQLQYYMLHII